MKKIVLYAFFSSLLFCFAGCSKEDSQILDSKTPIGEIIRATDMYYLFLMESKILFFVMPITNLKLR